MKENRIYCIEVSGECQYLMNINRPALAHLCGSTQGFYCNKNISWKPITKDTCKNCKEGRYQGLTRENAIEKMAKAIICRACEDYLHEDTDPLTSSASAVAYAKAALNALLEDNNDK